MLSYILAIAILAGCHANPLPEASNSCFTATTPIVVPTTTYTFFSTFTVTEKASTAKDLGTWTDVVQVRTNRTVKVLTSTVTDCIASQTFTHSPTSTIYTTSQNKQKRQECVVTVTSATTFGGTYTWIDSGNTTTYTDYTAFSLATVTRTTTGGTSYTVGTAYTTTCIGCGPTITPSTSVDAVTVTRDNRCAPAAITSAAGQYNGSAGFGILYLNDEPLGGATYKTSAQDASACCQLCLEEEGCASSGWDIRTNECRLMFPVQWDTGALTCGNGALAFYDYGPNHPIQPGTGWFMAAGCGYVQYAGTKPDDGS